MQITVFHGSKAPIANFDSKKNLSGYYPGFYTTSSEDKARTFGSILYSMLINDDKFYVLNDLQDSELLKKSARENGFLSTQGSGYQDVAYLKKIGYEGIKRGIEYIIFEPEKTVNDFQLRESKEMSFSKWIEDNKLEESDSNNNKVKCINDLVQVIRDWGDKYSISTRTFVWEHLNSSKGKELLKKILKNPKTYFSNSEFKKLVENEEK
ncbi:MAG: hypothetical protein EKK64_03420 [Neisseriaceae bacterium]|nr:MAG: hypothetical protein EKK64_03420 [Neisseriaceae bacterium]